MNIDRELIEFLKSDIEAYGCKRCFSKIEEISNALMRVLLREHMAIAEDELSCMNMLEELKGETNV